MTGGDLFIISMYILLSLNYLKKNDTFSLIFTFLFSKVINLIFMDHYNFHLDDMIVLLL